MTLFRLPAQLPRTALVTGGAKRMGRSLSLALAQAGFDVVVHYGESSVEAETLVKEIEQMGQRACAIHADLNHPAAIGRVVSQVNEQLGELGVLVNNASQFEYDVLNQKQPLSVELFESHFRINTFAPLSLMQQLSQQLTHGHHGVAINILDQKLHNPNPDFLSYTLSKAALEHATTLAAMSLAPCVRVVGIAPGLSLPSGDQTAADFAHAHAATLLQRGSTPDDIAQAMLYAISAQSMTGVTLIADGGQHLTAQSRDVMFTHRAV